MGDDVSCVRDVIGQRARLCLIGGVVVGELAVNQALFQHIHRHVERDCQVPERCKL